MFTSILTDLSEGLTIGQGVICTFSALGLGILIALVYRIPVSYTHLTLPTKA